MRSAWVLGTLCRFSCKIACLRGKLPFGLRRVITLTAWGKITTRKGWAFAGYIHYAIRATMDIEHYANSAMSRAVLHLWRRENYAKCEISMSHGNIQANNVIRFKSLRIATPITLCARITETACNNRDEMKQFCYRVKYIEGVSKIIPSSRYISSNLYDPYTYPWLILNTTWCWPFLFVSTTILLIKSKLKLGSRAIAVGVAMSPRTLWQVSLSPPPPVAKVHAPVFCGKQSLLIKLHQSGVIAWRPWQHHRSCGV